MNTENPIANTKDSIIMSIEYYIGEILNSINKLENSRERSLVLTKIEEAELWLSRIKS